MPKQKICFFIVFLFQILCIAPKTSAMQAEEEDFDSNNNCKQILDLSARRANLQSAIDKFPYEISELYLAKNGLKAIPKSVFTLPLEKLGLNNNLLNDLPAAMSTLSCLTTLNLGSNRFEKMPTIICKLSGLRELKLDNNRIKEIKSDISNLTNLITLEFGSDEGGNLVEEMPKELFFLTNLTHLSFDSNKLEKIPEDISQLTSLQALHLGDNEIRSSGVTPKLWLLTSLKVLIFGKFSGGNKLVSIPKEIGNLINLRELALTKNAIGKLTPAIAHCTKLEALHLSANRFEVLPVQISSLVNLNTLIVGSSLGGNLLSELPQEFTTLTNLTSLALTLNHFEEVPEVIGTLTNLKKLYMAYNFLRFIPKESLEHLTKLETLSLHHNPNLVILPAVVWGLNIAELVLDKEEKEYKKDDI